MRSGIIFSGLTLLAIAGFDPLAAQSLNHGYAAMDRGDFYAAFSAMRRLEQAGDPNAARVLEEVFLTPGTAAPTPPVPSPPVPTPTPAPFPAAAPRVVAPAPSISMAPAQSLRPQIRAVRARPLPPPLTDADFREIDAPLAAIGHLLFFDPILSGNRDTSCATCHHPRLGSSDGVSLGLGTGASGLGDARQPVGDHAASQRIPRNAPGLWNLGAREIHTLFHDGRLEIDPAQPDTRLSPQGPLGYMQLDSILAAQVLFPVLAVEEMSGRRGENPVADAVHDERIHGDDGAWAILAARVDAIPAYRAAFTDWRGREESVKIDEIANAIAAFIEAEFRADRSDFDAYLRELAAMSPEAGEGMRLFFGRGNCASCHSGPLLSDQNFHAMGQPPVGPGKIAGADGYTRDIGRGGVTLDPVDNFAFRTPMLRNVMATGPWGHAGAFSDIRAFLRHHIDPVAGLAAYAPQAVLPELDAAEGDYAALDNAALMAEVSAAAARSMAGRPRISLRDDEIALLVTFLETLTDHAALAGRRGVPETVPSGLEVAR